MWTIMMAWNVALRTILIRSCEHIIIIASSCEQLWAVVGMLWAAVNSCEQSWAVGRNYKQLWVRVNTHFNPRRHENKFCPSRDRFTEIEKETHSVTSMNKKRKYCDSSDETSSVSSISQQSGSELDESVIATSKENDPWIPIIEHNWTCILISNRKNLNAFIWIVCFG